MHRDICILLFIDYLEMLYLIIAAVLATNTTIPYMCFPAHDNRNHYDFEDCYSNLSCTTTAPYNVSDIRYAYGGCDYYTFFCQDTVKCNDNKFFCRNTIKCNSTCVDNVCQYRCKQCEYVDRCKEIPREPYILETLPYASFKFFVFTIFTGIVSKLINKITQKPVSSETVFYCLVGVLIFCRIVF